MRLVPAFGFLAWCVFIAVGAGLGSGLNCEYSYDCRDGSPAWFEPWTWGEYYVYPDALLVGLAGVVAATAFVAFVWARRSFLAALMLLVTLALISYPFFAGLTTSGRLISLSGSLLGVVALLSTLVRRSLEARTVALALAIGFWAWGAVVVVAGLIGAGVHCDSGACDHGSPTWFEPWTWDDYAVLPALVLPAAMGLLAATAVVTCVHLGRRRAALGALVVSIVLLSYPYFMSFPYEQGVHEVLWLGAVVGVAATCTTRRWRSQVT